MQQIDIADIINTLKAHKHFTSKILDIDTQQETFQSGTISTQFYDEKTVELYHSGQYHNENQSFKVCSRHCWQLTASGHLRLTQFTFKHKDCIIFTQKKHAYLGELYRCGADTYLATLLIRQTETCLEWRIHGPNKNLHIITTYQ